jgi:UDP-2,3-diacylglucosamine hydrolase
VSDAHFGLAGDERDKIGRFAGLAGEMRARASGLYILGDLFDFWIEYRYAIRPDYFPVLYELRRIADAGIKVCYLTGNHDFALGPFLEKAAGITVCRKPVNIELQGRKIHMRHGDDIHSGRLQSALLRNKFLQSAYKIIHPNIGVEIGKRLSAASRKKHDDIEMAEKDLEKYRRAAQKTIKDDGRDLVIFAHTHHAELITMDGGEYCNTGSWMYRYSYATLRDGKIQLLKWGDKAS